MKHDKWENRPHFRHDPIDFTQHMFTNFRAILYNDYDS